jgi:hypothetical protein
MAILDTMAAGGGGWACDLKAGSLEFKARRTRSGTGIVLNFLAPFQRLPDDFVVLTLFGALPFYCYVARESPRGEDPIAMLEHLLTWRKGKLFVLTLLGLAAADFIITIILSAMITNLEESQ